MRHLSLISPPWDCYWWYLIMFVCWCKNFQSGCDKSHLGSPATFCTEEWATCVKTLVARCSLHSTMEAWSSSASNPLSEASAHHWFCISIFLLHMVSDFLFKEPFCSLLVRYVLVKEELFGSATFGFGDRSAVLKRWACRNDELMEWLWDDYIKHKNNPTDINTIG